MILAAASLLFLALFLFVLGVARAAARRRVLSGARLRAVAGVRRERCDARPRAAGAGGPFWQDDRLCRRWPLLRRLELELRGAGIAMPLGTFVGLVLVIGPWAGSLCWMFSGSWAAGLLGAAIAVAVPVIGVRWRRQRRLRAFERQFPDALDMMVNALKSGVSLPAAIGVVADEAPDPIDVEFRVLLQQQKLGLELRDSLLDLRRRIDLVDVHLFTTSLIVQKETGGNLAEVLDNIAAVVRDRFRIMGDTRTLTEEGRMSGLILAALPVVVGTALFFEAPDHVRFLFDTAPGRAMLAGSILAEITGFLAIQRIVNFKL